MIRAITRAAGFKTANHTGEAGESFALTYYGGELADVGQKGYDIIDLDNRRIQVKTRKFKGSQADGVFYKKCFDLMAIVVYDDTGFLGIIEVPHDEYFERAKYRKDRSQWSMTISKELQGRMIPWKG